MNTAFVLNSTPQFRLIAMTEPDRPDRHTPTDIAPLPDEIDTQPPQAIPRAGRVPQLSEPIRDASVDQLLKMYAAAQARETDLLDAHGQLARLNEERAIRIKRETISELATIVDKIAGAPVRELTRKFDDLATTVREVKTDVATLEQQVAEMRGELVKLRDRIEQQEKDLLATNEILDKLETRLDKNAARAAETPPATQA